MPRRILLILVVAAALTLVPATPDAAAGTHRIKPVRVVGKVVVYRLPHMRPARIRRALIRAHRFHHRLTLRRIRRAVRRGVLRTRLVRRERRRSRLVLFTGTPRRPRPHPRADGCGWPPRRWRAGSPPRPVQPAPPPPPPGAPPPPPA